MKKNKKFIDPRYFMDEKTEIIHEDSEPDPCSPHPIGGEDDWDVEARLHRNKCGESSHEGEGLAGETLADYKKHPEWFN